MAVDILNLGFRVDTAQVKTASKDLDALSNSAKKAGGSLETLEKDAQKTAKGISAFGLSLKTLGIAATVYLLGSMTKEVTLLASRYHELGIVMNVVGRNAGYSRKELVAQEKALMDTGITMVEARNNIAKVISANIDLAKAAGLARIAQNAAVIGNMNSSQSFASLITAIQTAQTDSLRTIGINVNFEKSYRTLAAQLGKTASELTEVEKTTARVNAVFAFAPQIADVYTESLTNAGKQLRTTQRYLEDLRVKAGAVFDAVLVKAVMLFTSSLKDVHGEIDQLAKDKKLKQWGDNILTIFEETLVAMTEVAHTFGLIYDFVIAYGIAVGKILTLDFSGLKKHVEEYQRALKKGNDEQDRLIKSLRDRGEAQKAAKPQDEAALKVTKDKIEADRLAAETAEKLLALREEARKQLEASQKTILKNIALLEAENKLLEAGADAEEAKLVVQLKANGATDGMVKRAQAAETLNKKLLASIEVENDLAKAGDAAAKAQDDINKGLDDAIQAQKDENKLRLGLIKSIDESVIARLEEVKAAQDLGGIVNPALEEEIQKHKTLNMEKQYTKALDAEKEANEKRVKEAEKVAEELKKINDKVAEDFNESLTDALFRGFEAGKSFAKSFKDSLINSFKTLILRPIVSFIVDSSGIAKVMGGIMAGASGSSIAGVAGAAGQATSMWDGVTGAATSVWQGVTSGFEAANIAFEQSIQNFGTWVTSFGDVGSLVSDLGGMISEFSGEIANVLPYAGAVLKLLQGDAKGAAFTAAGTAIGSTFGAAGAAIGAFIGSVVGSFFGSDDVKRYSARLASEMINGKFIAGEVDKGGGDRLLKGADPQLRALNESFAATLGNLFESSGLTASFGVTSGLSQKTTPRGSLTANIDGTDFRVDVEGKDLNKAFETLIGKAFSDVMIKAIQASYLSDSIKSLFDGIVDKDQAIKMTVAAANLNRAEQGLIKTFNLTADQAAQVAIASTSTTDALIEFTSAMAALGDSTKSMGERILDIKNKILTAFTEVTDLNALPKDLAAFDNLLKAINKTTEEGIAEFTDLFRLRHDFINFTNAINELKSGVSTALFSLKSPSEQAATMMAELGTIFGTLNLTVPQSVAELQALATTIDYTTEAGLTLASAFPKLVSVFMAAQQAAEQVLAESKQTLIQAFATERERLQGVIANVKNAEDALREAFNSKSLGLQDTINKFKDFGASIRAFRQSLGETMAGNSLGAAKSRFSTVSALALAGNEEALQDIQGASVDYLKAFELYSGDFVEYQRAFATVSDTLLAVENASYSTASVAELQLNALKTQVSNLITLDMDVLSVEAAIVELQAQQALGVAAQVQLTALNAQQVSLLGSIDGGIVNLATALAAYNSAVSANVAAKVATLAPKVVAKDVAKDVAALDGGALVAALKSATGSASSTAAYALVREQYGKLNNANVEAYLRTNYPTQYFASGGAFNNGVVSSPTAFNMGVMGEGGSEAIMPLANINGKLGVSANNSEMVKHLAVISEKISRLESVQIATAQNTGKVARVIERADNGDSLNMTVVV